MSVLTTLALSCLAIRGNAFRSVQMALGAILSPSYAYLIAPIPLLILTRTTLQVKTFVSTTAHTPTGSGIILPSHASKLAQGRPLDRPTENVSRSAKMDCSAYLLVTGNVLPFAPWDGGDSLMPISASMTPTVPFRLYRVQYHNQQSLRRQLYSKVCIPSELLSRLCGRKRESALPALMPKSCES